MDLVTMLDAKIEDLKKEYNQCTNEIEKKQIAYTLNEMKILRYEYELNNGMIEIIK